MKKFTINQFLEYSPPLLCSFTHQNFSGHPKGKSVGERDACVHTDLLLFPQTSFREKLRVDQSNLPANFDGIEDLYASRPKLGRMRVGRIEHGLYVFVQDGGRRYVHVGIAVEQLVGVLKDVRMIFLKEKSLLVHL